MDSSIKLSLAEEFITTDAIILYGPKYEETPIEHFLDYDNSGPVMISVHCETGEPLHIVWEGYVGDIEYAIEGLREKPLPWNFSLPEMNIYEKPLEDILLALYEKYKDVKMGWDE